MLRSNAALIDDDPSGINTMQYAKVRARNAYSVNVLDGLGCLLL